MLATTYVFFSNVPQRVCGEKKKAHMRSMGGERSVSLGFELTFYPSSVSLFGGCLYSQAPAKVPFEVLIKNFHFDEQRIACYYSRFRI